MRATLNLAARRRGELSLFELETLRPWGVDAVITGRDGGVSDPPYDTLNLGAHVGDDPAHVAENRRRVAAALALAPAALVIAHQVHGVRVHDVDQWRGEPLEGDALVTTRADVALGVLVADCLPLVFTAAHHARFAVAHAGWRGLDQGVIAATLSHFEDPSDVRVVIGPHISASRYQVGPDVAEHFAGVRGALRADVGDRSRLDLAVVAREQLARAGVDLAHVAHCDLATDDGHDFFSDRATRPCGRFGLFARRSYDATATEGIQ